MNLQKKPVYIDPNLHQQIKQIALSEGRPVYQIVHEILTKALKERG